MPYKSETLTAVLKRLNSQYLLPAIQRQFIWDQEQIISLFDSIMRGYPIGSFLFWQLANSNRDKWEAYKFVEDATQSQGGTRNKLANVEGINELTLILDGQQRLTSFLVGLKGTYTIKKKYLRYDDPAAWIKQKLYLDLLKDPKTEAEYGETGIHYGFEFFEKQPPTSNEHYWFRVGKILDFESEDGFYDFRQEQKKKLPDNVSGAQISIFEKNLDRLYRASWKDDIISYYTEYDQDYDRVLDIFVRANEGGTKLSKSDLLLSMITSKWKGMNARDEIFDFVERLNGDLALKNNFNKDFVMKSCLVLSDLPVAYKVQNFNLQNLVTIQNNWPIIKASIEKAVDLTNNFGIDGSTLTSSNALVPIAYYFSQHQDLNLRKETPSDSRITASVRRWITMALLNRVFGGSSDNILAKIREVIKKNAIVSEFPISEINRETAKMGRTSFFNEDAVNEFLGITYSDKLAFLALSLLYDDNRWGITPYHKDHIFPKSMFEWDYMREAGYTREQYFSVSSRRDYLGNLELLLSVENQAKLNIPFEKWIKTRNEGFLKRHLIPDDPKLWKLENFREFLLERQALIKARLQLLFGREETKEE